MMYYDGQLNQLQISNEVFNKLATNTDIAAARVHEALYYAIRNHSVINSKYFNKKLDNSIPVRRLVGCLFSDDLSCLNNSIYKQDFINDSIEAFLCQNNKLSYYLFRRGPLFEALSSKANCGKTNSQWIGMYDRIEHDTIGVPALFVAYKDEMSPNAGSCSPLMQYYFSVSLNIRDIDNSNQVPSFSNFYDGDNNLLYYGTPSCVRLK